MAMRRMKKAAKSGGKKKAGAKKKKGLGGGTPLKNSSTQEPLPNLIQLKPSWWTKHATPEKPQDAVEG